MSLRYDNGTLFFDKTYSGDITGIRQKPDGEHDREIAFGKLYSGQKQLSVAEKAAEQPGLYVVRCNQTEIGKVYLGKKPRVQWTVAEYTNFGNQGLYRHKLDFQNIVVNRNEFTLKLKDSKEIVEIPYDENCTAYTFLHEKNQTGMEFDLSPELAYYIDK